jgi:hypothetical protein
MVGRFVASRARGFQTVEQFVRLVRQLGQCRFNAQLVGAITAGHPQARRLEDPVGGCDDGVVQQHGGGLWAQRTIGIGLEGLGLL